MQAGSQQQLSRIPLRLTDFYCKCVHSAHPQDQHSEWMFASSLSSTIWPFPINSNASTTLAQTFDPITCDEYTRLLAQFGKCPKRRFSSTMLLLISANERAVSRLVFVVLLFSTTNNDTGPMVKAADRRSSGSSSGSWSDDWFLIGASSSVFPLVLTQPVSPHTSSAATIVGRTHTHL